LGEAIAATIAKRSNVSRVDVYRILSELEELGLVEKVIATPTEFRPVPIEDGLSILLKRKDNEYIALNTKVEQLIQKIKNISNSISQKNEPQQMVLIKEEEARRLRMKRLYNSTKVSVDFVNKWVYYVPQFSANAEIIERALNRGVKIRIITNKPKNQELPRQLKAITKNPLYDIKHIRSTPAVIVGIFDRREAAIASVGNVDSPVPMFYTANNSIVDLSISYFEQMWKKSERFAGALADGKIFGERKKAI
jgi:sugar-specific transcriptional regulator TrmB